MQKNCYDLAKSKITAYAADYLDYQKKEDITEMRKAFDKEKSVLKGRAAIFWSLVKQAHDDCNTDQRHLVRAEIVRVLNRLEALCKDTDIAQEQGGQP